MCDVAICNLGIYVDHAMAMCLFFHYMQTGVDEIREAYRRKLEMLMRDVSDLARAVAIMQVSGAI